MKKYLLSLGIVALLILNVFMGVRLTGLEQELNTLKNKEPQSVEVQQPVVQKTNVTTMIESDVSEVYSKVQNSVVTVVNNPLGTGSGVIYKIEGNDGFIITNHHVIANNEAVEIVLSSGSRKEASVLGSDSLSDIALLKFKADEPITPMVLGDSSALNVGETVLAIGSPSGENFSGSLSVGVVSGKDRVIEVDTDGNMTPDWDMVLIQTDAAINPGNSGGALVNMAGQLVGINTLKLLDITVEGMGFANPINEVVSILNQLEENGEVTRPFVGISGLSVQDLIARSQFFNIELPSVQEGVFISEVVANSPASRAGIQSGDVIVKFDDYEIDDFKTFRRYLYQFKIGDKVDVEIVRGDETLTLTINL